MQIYADHSTANRKTKINLDQTEHNYVANSKTVIEKFISQLMQRYQLVKDN